MVFLITHAHIKFFFNDKKPEVKSWKKNFVVIVVTAVDRLPFSIWYIHYTYIQFALEGHALIV